MLRTLLLLFMLLWASPVWASLATVYVGQSLAGADTGADCANQHAVTFFNTAGNWGVGASQIGQDTTVHLCGTITSTLTVQGSGAAGHTITVLWETGAKLSQPACSITTGCLNTNSQTYLTFNGGTNGIIESNNNGTYPTYGNSVSSEGINADGCSNCEFKNLTIQNIYVRNSTSDIGIDQSQMRCIHFSGSTVLIHDNTMHDAGWCIFQFYGDGDAGVKIYNNNIYNIDHGWCPCSTTSGTGQDFYFYNNHVHDYVNWDSTNNSYHHDGIHAFNTGTGKQATMWIYDNLFDGDVGVNVTSHIFLESWSDSTGVGYMFNNIFIANHLINGIVQVGLGTTWQVYDNTVIGFSSGSGTCLTFGNTTLAKFKNNVITGCDTLLYLTNITFTSSAADLNYNVYANCASNCLWWNTVVGPTTSLATWQAGCNCDANAVKVASAGISGTGYPSVGSAIIGAATNLTSLGITSLNADKSGRARPASAAWDAGAYNYATVGCIKIPLPPTGLKITTGVSFAPGTC